MLKRSFKFSARESQSGLIGYAFRFNETINYMGQLERFSPDLKVDMNTAGTFLFRDHNPERVLARAPDTLNFKTDSEGLLFNATALDTELWKETRELVSKGVLNGASVGFSSTKDRQDKDTLIYEQIKLYEVSLVTWPAYQSSEVKSRAKVKQAYPPELIL